MFQPQLNLPGREDFKNNVISNDSEISFRSGSVNLIASKYFSLSLEMTVLLKATLV